MNKKVLIIITLGLLIIIGFIFWSDPQTKTAKNNVEIKDGIQYVTINAKGGYFPGVSSAKAGIPTKIIMKTEGTYDCSAALSIRSVGFQKILPQNAETVIDIGIPKAGEPITGVCGMGMYSFDVNFKD